MKLNSMKKQVLALVLISAGGSAVYAGEFNQLSLQQTARRPYAAHVQHQTIQTTSANADQAWEGATLQTNAIPDLHGLKTRKQQLRERLNLQFASKRPYLFPAAE